MELTKPTKGNGKPVAMPQQVRCAIYTRKSTDEGLEQEFNSLDAQRESAEAYIASQKSEGWEVVDGEYSDGGFSGGNMERPALKRLLADIEAGNINMVVVYKIDRLSRSLLDFTRMMELFETRGVSFVSVTQQINTSTSSGRLMLNILLSFAQFEREMTAERTRDKMGAARRKGKWVGGVPVLGYDVAPEGGRLLVNQEEAAIVRQLFSLYLARQSLLQVAQEASARGWTTKTWTSKSGKRHQGLPFNKNRVNALLKNPVYAGLIDFKGERFEGEHEPIIDPETFEKVQELMQANRQRGGSRARNKYGALLSGLLRCKVCDTAMIHSHTRKGKKVYRYYVCTHAQKEGWQTCSVKSISAPQLEEAVVEQIKAIGQDDALIDVVLAQVQELKGKERANLDGERKRLEKEVRRIRVETRNLVDAMGQGESGTVAGRIRELEGQMQTQQDRITALDEQLAAMEADTVDRADLAKVLGLFDPIWEVLYPQERIRILHLLLDTIDWDGRTLGIEFRSTGIKALAGELEEAYED